MKKILFALLILSIAARLFGQENDTTEIRISERDLIKVVESKEGTRIFLRGKQIINVREVADSTTIAIGHKKLIISDTGRKTMIEMVDERSNERKIIYNETHEHIRENHAAQDTLPPADTSAPAMAEEPEEAPEEQDDYPKEPPRRWSDFEEFDQEWEMDKKEKGEFKGNWFSVDWGLNNYLDPNGSVARNDENRYMDLNTGRSWNFNINFSQHSIGLISDRVGLISGLGIEINNYHFDDKNTISKENGIIVPDYRFDTSSILIKKNRLATTYLTLPLVLEAQLTGGERKERIYVSVGVIGGLRLGTNIKVKYTEDGNKKKYKEKGDDFNLNTFRYGLTAKAGYKSFSIFARYYLTPLFEKGNGPELYPLAMGLSLNL